MSYIKDKDNSLLTSFEIKHKAMYECSHNLYHNNSPSNGNTTVKTKFHIPIVKLLNRLAPNTLRLGLKSQSTYLFSQGPINEGIDRLTVCLFSARHNIYFNNVTKN